MKLYCKTCRIEVTNNLQELEDCSVLKKERDGKDYLPRGFYSHSKNLFPHMEDDDQFIVNSNDVINCQNHEDQSRLNGCCGLAGCDGPNQVCVNGHEIGTKRSDCWTYHYTSFDVEAVVMVA